MPASRYRYPVRFYIPTGYAKTASGGRLECPPRILTRRCDFFDLSGSLTVTGDSESGNWTAQIDVVGIPRLAEPGQIVADYRRRRLYTIDVIKRHRSNHRVSSILMFDSNTPYREPVFIPDDSVMYLCQTVSFNDQLVTFTPGG